MAVYDLENGTRVVELGLGTTLVSTLIHEEDEAAHYILFSPLDLNKEKNEIVLGDLKGNEVLIRITNASGIASYLLAVLNLLETWNIVGEHEKVMEVRKQMEELRKILQSIR